MLSLDVIKEANDIVTILKKSLPKIIDGKEAILELKEYDYHWRQMEWIGWYFENKIYQILSEEMGGTHGPVYGNTSFDYQKKHVWDFKAHPILTTKGKPNDTMILNDKEAVETCISEKGGLGFVVVNGHAAFDDSGEFKLWHDVLKGGKSTYEIERIKRGAPSRTRKIAFEIDSIDSFFLANQSELIRGINEGWLTFFQEGMRNADGSPRRPKYALRAARAPRSIRAIDSMRY